MKNYPKSKLGTYVLCTIQSLLGLLYQEIKALKVPYPILHSVQYIFKTNAFRQMSDKLFQL